MTDEYVFAVLFLISFLTFWFVRVYYIRKTRDPNARRSRKERRAAMRKEGHTGIALAVDAQGTPADHANRVRRAGAAARLSCGGSQGHRCRSAAQLGEIGYGGVSW